MVDGRARTLTSLLMNAPTMRSPRDRTKVTEFVKISTLVLVQQQQLGSLLLSSRSTLRLAAVAVRLVIPLLYSLKRFEAEGPSLLRPILLPMRFGGQLLGRRSAKLAEGEKQRTIDVKVNNVRKRPLLTSGAVPTRRVPVVPSSRCRRRLGGTVAGLQEA